MVRALEYCLKNDFMNLEIFLDSKLVVEQVNGNFKVKSNNLKPLRDKILEHIEMLEFVSINHIYRENNKRADELANLALDS